MATPSRAPYFAILTWLAYFNLLLAAIVSTTALSLDGARVFFAATIVAEYGLGNNMIDWINMIRRRSCLDGPTAKYKLAFLVFFLAASAIVALQEIHTCYFADVSVYESIAECANIWTKGSISTFVDPSESVCSGKVINDELLGECAAAQVSSRYIKIARAAGLACGIFILIQCVISVAMFIIFTMYAEADMAACAILESKLNFIVKSWCATKTNNSAQLAIVEERIDRCTEQQIQEAAQLFVDALSSKK